MSVWQNHVSLRVLRTVTGYLQQPSSSLPSAQSAPPSHFQVEGIHREWSAHWNCSELQVFPVGQRKSFLGNAATSTFYIYIYLVSQAPYDAIECFKMAASDIQALQTRPSNGLLLPEESYSKKFHGDTN